MRGILVPKGHRLCPACDGWGYLRAGRIEVNRVGADGSPLRLPVKAGRLVAGFVPSGTLVPCGTCMGAGYVPEEKKEGGKDIGRKGA